MLVCHWRTSSVTPTINGIDVGLSFTVCVIVQAVVLTGPLVQWKFTGGGRKEAEQKRLQMVSE